MLHARDRENVHVHARPGKNFIAKPLATKSSRPALGEVSNKIDEIQKIRLQKLTVNDVHLKKPTQLKEIPTKKIDNKNVGCLKLKSPLQKPKPTIDLEINKKCEKKVAYSSRRLVDVEEQDKGDPLLVAEYVQDIYRYLLELETKYCIKPNFLENHKSTPRMRSILIDWLVDAHRDLAYILETLHLAVSLVDRYLQIDRTVDRNNLQLVGVCALWVAAKYEEMYVANLKDYVSLADNAFTEDDVIKMEHKMLVAIDWTLGLPHAIHFLKRFSKLAKVQPKEYVLGKYLLEIALVTYEICYVKPSMLAAAAVCLSVAILNDLNNPSTVWTDELAEKVSYTYTELREIVIQLAQVLIKQETSKYQTVKKKYSESKFYKISVHPKLSCNFVKSLAGKSIKKA